MAVVMVMAVAIIMVVVIIMAVAVMGATATLAVGVDIVTSAVAGIIGTAFGTPTASGEPASR
jgi:hypothetical protein